MALSSSRRYIYYCFSFRRKFSLPLQTHFCETFLGSKKEKEKLPKKIFFFKKQKIKSTSQLRKSCIQKRFNNDICPKQLRDKEEKS